MLKLLSCFVMISSLAFSAAIMPAGKMSVVGRADCSRTFVDDTLLSPNYAFEHLFGFCKDSGETLGVAAVWLHLKEIDQVSGYSNLIDFDWKWGGGTYGGADARVTSSSYSRGDSGYIFLAGLSAKGMAYSNVGADTLSAYVNLFFLADTALKIKVGDTLHWTLSFIYFHSSQMPIWSWSNKTEPVSWVGSDTVTIRYRTIMRSLQPSEIFKRKSMMREGKMLGRFDLQGRPLRGSSCLPGIVLERTEQGYRKRLQLR